MSNSLMTDEFKPKKSFMPLIILLVVLLLISGIGYGIYRFVEYSKEQKKLEEEKKKLENPLNDELQNLYGFGVSNNYIVAIKKDGSMEKIYNLLQGTGQFGDFVNFFYYDKKLYLLFSDNNIYTISLDSGNRVYEIEEFFTLDKVTCVNGTNAKTTDLTFNNKSIYVNTSSCGLGLIKYNSKDKNYNYELIRTFNTPSVLLEYANNMLFVKADNEILLYDLKNKTTKSIVQNINVVDMKLKNNILIYSSIVNNELVYFGYNINKGESSSIVSGKKDLVLYNNSFIYRSNDTVYLLKNGKEEEIYKVHYNTLSDMNLVGKDTLQVIDTDSNDEEKKRIINIELNNKYKANIVSNDFTNIVEYTK